MTSQQLRQKFLNFFQKNNHVIIPSAPLVPSDEEQLEGKEKVLFTSAGMQPLIPYLMGKPHPKGNKLADVQKCVRTDDIEEVGDTTHHTFFEMLGNWSLGAYWKKEAIELSFKFLTQELNIPLDDMAVSVFAGDDDAPRDEESASKWKQLGISEKRIAYLGKEANWWPTNPSAFGPCGPDTEMFIWTGENPAPEEFDPKDLKWVEVWNDVFMEFNRKADGTLEELPQKNVDTGMGLERMLAVINGKDNDYETDLFENSIDTLESKLLPKFKYGDEVRVDKAFRIVADHLRASVFLIAEGVVPSNKEHGYVLRRLIRGAAAQKYLWGERKKSLSILVDQIIKDYQGFYSELKGKEMNVGEIIVEEENKFNKALEEAIKERNKWVHENAGGFGSDVWGSAPFGSSLSEPKLFPAVIAFRLFESHGLGPDILENINGAPIDREGFNKLLNEHREISKSKSNQKFVGGLADHSEIVTKYHTATHLLHQALRDVLGPQVFQKGSNITSERLRFDFSFDRKMTDEEIKQVEEIINQRIKEDLKVDHMIIPLEKAKQMNAIGLFNEKYADKVSIYGVGPDFKLDPKAKDTRVRGGYYSLEFCGGPHVEHTNIIGKIKITKEEAVSSGIRRIRAVIN